VTSPLKYDDFPEMTFDATVTLFNKPTVGEVVKGRRVVRVKAVPMSAVTDVVRYGKQTDKYLMLTSTDDPNTKDKHNTKKYMWLSETEAV
jgi:hypothetical protein